jgi:diguanylate cyclase (GGDEF)-like protein
MVRVYVPGNQDLEVEMAWTKKPEPMAVAPGEAGVASPELDEPDDPQEPALRIVGALLEPLRVEVSLVQGPDCDKPLRRLLGDLKYDVDAGLTNHSARRAEEVLSEAIPLWFAERKSAMTEREAQFTELLGQLGASLFKMERREDRSTTRIRDGLSNIENGQRRPSPIQVKKIVANVVKALDDMRAENARQVQKMSSKIRDLHEQVVEKTLEAQIDRLTGLNNRSTFDDGIARMIARSRLAPYRYTLLLIDIDHFKAVNDTHGHVEGDRVLKAVAMQLEKVVMRKDDFLGRYGGEEFTVLLSDSDGEAGARTAERIRKAVESMTVSVNGTRIYITVSIGVSEGCRTDSPTKLLKRADDSLYIAKKMGRNRVVVAGEGTGSRVRLPRELANRAKAARKARLREAE